jgi:inhibitor of cysteine peptidase
MKKLIKVLVLLSLLLTALTACGSANEVELNASDDGSQVDLNAGQMLVISLEGNPTTGYTWEVAELAGWGTRIRGRLRSHRVWRRANPAL